MKLLAILLMVAVLFISCGSDDDDKKDETNDNTVETQDEVKETPDETVVTDTEVADTAETTDTTEVTDEEPTGEGFGKACEAHENCPADASVCIPAMAADYGMVNAGTCTVKDCTEGSCPGESVCVDMTGDYNSFRPMVDNAETLCLVVAEQ